MGIHALRGGTVAGTHTVHFFGPDEELELTHRAASRRIFVNGALHMARSAAGTAQRGLRPAENLVWRVTMNAQEIIDYIASSPKRTPVKIYINLTAPVDFGSAQVFGEGGSRVVFGDWAELAPILEANRERITDLVVENDRRNSGVPLLDLKDLPARIEPGAIIREQVTIGENAVIMMGAILNIGAVVGRRTMIDMGAVLGGRATVGDDCHIGAGAVLAGVVEPASATPVMVEDGVLVGANAVVIEGVRIGAGAVVAAGAVVTEDVPPNAVVAGTPARVVKMKDARTTGKTALVDALRSI